MKITAKTTKEQLVQFLGANAKAIREKDEDLYSRVAYANKMLGKDESKVTKKDLVDLAKEAMKLLGDDVAESVKTEEAKPKAENSVKAKPKKKTKEVPESVESEETEEVSEEKPAEEPKSEKVDKKKKSAKKPLGKKKKKEPKEGVVAIEGTENPKTIQMASVFPQTLKVSDKEYELASDIKTMDDLYEAVINKEEEIVIAHYWSKRHLKQFLYYSGALGQPKSFDYDLDLSAVIHVSEDKIVSYALSLYTEALYAILPNDLEEEDGMRYNNGIEYQIYRTV